MIPWEAQWAMTQQILVLAEGFCQQKAPMHHALDTEGTQVLLWPGLNVENSAPLGGCL